MIRAIKQAYFTNGVMLSGSVRQSLAVVDDAEAPRFGGVHRVAGMEMSEFGILIVDKNTKYLVPWHMVTSCVIDAVPEVIVEPPPVDEHGAFIREVARAPDVALGAEVMRAVRVDTRKKLPPR